MTQPNNSDAGKASKSVSLDKSIIRQLSDYGKARGLSFSWVINDAARQYLAKSKR
jgi:hypothetical protein